MAVTFRDLWSARTEPCLLERVLASTLGRFLLVGSVSYVVNQVSLVALYELVLGGSPSITIATVWRVDIALVLASVLALELSILVRFTLNDLWTFRNRGSRSWAGRLYLFQVGSLVSPLFALVVVNILTPMFGLNYLVANSLGILLGLAWNWYFSSVTVWRLEPVRTGTRLSSRNS